MIGMHVAGSILDQWFSMAILVLNIAKCAIQTTMSLSQTAMHLW